MAKKDQTETLLQRLEDGTAEIYSRYENLIRTSAAAKEKNSDRRRHRTDKINQGLNSHEKVSEKFNIGGGSQRNIFR